MDDMTTREVPWQRLDELVTPESLTSTGSERSTFSRSRAKALASDPRRTGAGWNPRRAA